MDGDGERDDAEDEDEDDGDAGVNAQVVQVRHAEGEQRADEATDGAPLGQLDVLVLVVAVVHQLRSAEHDVSMAPNARLQSADSVQTMASNSGLMT